MTGSQHWPSYSAFCRDRVVLGETLVVPVRVAWRAYLDYCAEWGFEPAPPADLVRWLAAEEGVRLREGGGGGRLRRCFEGAGLRAREEAA